MAYDVFISYRRDGGSAEARLLRAELIAKKLNVFLDVADLKRGYFDEALLRHIAEAPNFVVVLSKDSLDRCSSEEDWLRREIEHAIATKRNIIPVMLPGFSWPASLPSGMQSLKRHQAVEYSHRYFDATVAAIEESIRLEREERKPAATPSRDPRLEIFTLEGAAKIHWKERVRLAEELGKAGDPRLRMPSDPDYWVEIPGAGFKIGRYPVTVWEYGKYLAVTKTTAPLDWEEQSQHPNRPVTRVSHHDAEAYCKWANCRLPTGQEWERAAAGVEGRKYPWGNQEPDEDRLNFLTNVGLPSPVGAFPRGNTQEGLSDMGGNVWEWTDSQSARAELRGGSWYCFPANARNAERHIVSPEDRYYSYGFRCALT
ncbi:MAG: SUMF1/EgtB/PvdO family nonheme iron enzyme [Bryobacteraceae bacterium]